MGEQDFDLCSYGQDSVVPAAQLLLEELNIPDTYVVFKPSVVATHADCLNRIVQIGGYGVFSMLRGDIALGSKRLFDDRLNAWKIRDGHDMVAHVIIHEAVHLWLSYFGLGQRGHDRMFHSHNRTYFWMYCQLLGDLLRGDRPTSPPFFLGADPEIVRYREFMWGRERKKWVRLQRGTRLIIDDGNGHSSAGAVVRLNKQSYHIRCEDGQEIRMKKWHTGFCPECSRNWLEPTPKDKREVRWKA